MKKDTKLILIVLAGILAIVLLCIFAVQGTQNKAFTLEEQVNTAQSDIRVQEKRRVDLVYNLADCVMQYDKHEAETLTAIVEGRGSSGDIENVATAITAVSEAWISLLRCIGGRSSRHIVPVKGLVMMSLTLSTTAT